MGSTLLSSINTGRETLMSHGAAMAALSDNVANSNTTGFKSGQTEFADLLARGEGTIGDLSAAEAGDGVQLGEVRSMQTQGTLETTGAPYDLGVDGKGFFAVASQLADGTASANIQYTRAGDFHLDPSGKLVNAENLLVMGIPAGGDGTALAPISISDAKTTPVATTTGTMTGNLNNEDPTVTFPAGGIASDSQLGALNPFAAVTSVVDSLGQTHGVSVNFFKTGANQWTAQAFGEPTEITGGVAGVPQALGAPLQITFGPDGKPTVTPATLNITANWLNGATPTAAAFDLSGFTGFATPSSVTTNSQNGVRAGAPTGVEFAENGAVNVTFDNGSHTQIGTVALARFPNEGGLIRAGNTLFDATADAGAVKYGAPVSNGNGALKQGTLENSNVDLADQFVDVIKIQRTYQAGSQVIKTANELLTTTLQIA